MHTISSAADGPHSSMPLLSHSSTSLFQHLHHASGCLYKRPACTAPLISIGLDLSEGILGEKAPAGARASAPGSPRALVGGCLALREHLQRIHAHLGIVHLHQRYH